MLIDLDALRVIILEISDQYQGDDGDFELYYTQPFVPVEQRANMFWGDERNGV